MQLQYQVQQSTNHDEFTFLKGNRTPNMVHVKRLIASFEKQQLFSPIIVNERKEIIDGQHRYLAAKHLRLPIHYIVVYGYGLREVQILNTNAKNWNKIDYLNAYCDMGVVPYLEMRQFMRNFPDFGVAVSEQLLTCNVGGSNNKARTKDGGRVKNFEEGRLNIPDLSLSYKWGNMVMDYKQYYDGYNRVIFIAALLTVFRNKNYDHRTMMGKLSYQTARIQHCATSGQYIDMLEEIYNYRNRNKVSLKY